MGLISPLRSAIGWLWKRSGHPLVLPLAVLALLLQARHLAEPATDPVYQCGAAKTWVALAKTDLGQFVQRHTARWYPPFRQRHVGEHFLLYWKEVNGEFKFVKYAPQYRADLAVGSFTIDPTHPRQFIGLWAPTRYDGDITFQHWHGVGFDSHAARLGFSVIYKSDSVDFDPAVYRAIQNSQAEYSGVLVAGYWHNFLAMALTGMLIRGCIGMKGWLRSKLHLSRNRPRRRYSLLIRFGHPIWTLLFVVAIFLSHAGFIGSGQGNHSGSGRIVGSFAPGADRFHQQREPLLFDYARGRYRDHMLPAGRDPFWWPSPNSYRIQERNSEMPKLASVSIVEYGEQSQRGLWAPTVERTDYPVEIVELQALTQIERDATRPLLVKALLTYYMVPSSGQWSQSVARGESSSSRVILSGYAHNAFALLLVAVMIRLVVGYRVIQTARLERRQCAAMRKEQARA